MKCKLRKKLILISTLLSFSLSTSFFVNGQTTMEQKRDELKSDNNDLSKSIDDAKTKIEEQKNKKSELDLEISGIQSQINFSIDQISELDDQINNKLEVIKGIEKDMEKNRELFKQGANILFKYGKDVGALGILLNCSDMNNLFSTYQMIKALNERQNKIIKSLNESSSRITVEKEEIEVKRERVSAEKRDLESKKSTLYRLIEESDKLIEKLHSVEQEKEKQLDLNSQEIKSLDEEIADYYFKQEQERKKREAQQQSQSGSSSENVNVGSSGAGYAWPTPGFTTLSSTFDEWRGSCMHGAIDIAGRMIYGTPIVAAQSGTVITAVTGCSHYSAFCYCGGGYGNYVVIDHGGGRSTLYAHQCKVIVHCGQQVEKGQIIGYVGSTGFSTGPHLHFETRKYVNGKIQRYNPMLEY